VSIEKLFKPSCELDGRRSAALERRAMPSPAKPRTSHGATCITSISTASWTVHPTDADTSRGELFGLKWDDVDFERAEIRIVRSVVDQVEGPPKTLASRRPVPMSSELASALANWRKQTSYSKQGDWVFASPQALGQKPYWPDAVLKRHVLPAAKRAGIAKHIGWHTFRRTVATLLLSSGASVKTAQELMRHASPDVTVGIYAKALTADKREAQDKLVALFLGDSARGAEARI